MKIVKIVVGVILILLSFATFTESFIGGLFVLLSGSILMPPIEQKLKAKFKFLKKRPIYFAAILIPLVIGSNLGRVAEETRIEKSTISNKKVIEYIQTTKDDKSLNNIKNLAKVGDLFDESNYAFERIKKHLEFKADSLTGNLSFEFNPKFYYKEKAEYITFLKEYPDKGRLDDYRIRFDVDSLGNILTKNTIITYSKGSVEKFKNSDAPSSDIFIDENKVALQEQKVEEEELIKAAEEEKKKGMEAYNKRVKKFEDNCLNPWNGSHILFARMIKEQLNDPSSFEHVNTTFRLFNGYAVVNMTFRGKNAFNATVTNKMSAKVSLEDCSVLEIFE